MSYHRLGHDRTHRHHLEPHTRLSSHGGDGPALLRTASRLSITWHKRSLQQFADAPLADLAARFDLMVIDHPSIGEAAHHNLLLPLDEHLPAAFSPTRPPTLSANPIAATTTRAINTRSRSMPRRLSPATAPTCSSVPTPNSRYLGRPPRARPPRPCDGSRNSDRQPDEPVMLANALGAEPFAQPDEVISEAAGIQALQLLRELVQLSAPGSLDRNPIRTWQFLADSDTVAYCPFAYGYSNYSRAGLRREHPPCRSLVSLNGKPLRSTLGGAGLAISRSCKHAGARARVCRIRRRPIAPRRPSMPIPEASRAIAPPGSIPRLNSSTQQLLRATRCPHSMLPGCVRVSRVHRLSGRSLEARP